jgi:hypothetical protein
VPRGPRRPVDPKRSYGKSLPRATCNDEPKGGGKMTDQQTFDAPQQIECPGCGEPFEQNSPRHRFCSTTCRSRNYRGGEAKSHDEAYQAADVTPITEQGKHDTADEPRLVVATRKALDDAGRLDTFAGQQAMHLAEQMSSNKVAIGVAALNKELKATMDRALLNLVRAAYATFPAYKQTLGPEVCDIATLAGLPPDPEQELALDALFALNPRDPYMSAAFEFALICARQNMKTALFQMAALGWLFVTDQRLVVWSAHEMSTTTEAFEDIVNLIENAPPLSKRLDASKGKDPGVMRGNGKEVIWLTPTDECPRGQRLKFKARTYGGGRGLTGNKIVLDEAYALKKSHMGSLMPTLSAVKDPQIVYGSSAGHADSEVLRTIRDRGRAGTSARLGYMEFCAPEGICLREDCTHERGTPGCACDDMNYIRMANPATGRRISEEYLLAERDSLDPGEFGRERMGWWDKPEIADLPLISEDLWESRKDVESSPVDPVSFGVYVNRMQTNAAIGVAAYRSDGKVHVGIVPAAKGQLADSLPGTGWIPNRVKELADQWKPCATVIDGYSSAASQKEAIEELGVELEVTNSSDLARACGNFYAFVNEDKLKHQGSLTLARSVTSAKKRDLADAWAWDRKDDSSDITQLMAVTLALQGLILHGHTPEIEVWGMFT